jgi:hypothetical protein
VALITLNITPPNYNVDSQAKVLSVDQARDCYYEKSAEGKYIIRRRPGHSLFANTGAPEVIVGGIVRTGQGIFWSDRLSAAFVVAGGNLYKLASDGTAAQIVGATLNTGRYAVFAEGQTLALAPFIYIAHGGTLRYTDGATLATPSDPNVPTSASFVATLNNRVWADNGGQDFYITDTDPATSLFDPFYWSMVDNPWRAAMKADTVQALIAAWNEVAVWGTQTIEYWQEDGVNPISPLVGATSEFGTTCPNTIVMADNTLFSLATMNGKRAVVKLSNRSPQIISGDIDRELQGYDTITDAVGALVFVGGINHYVLNFPSSKKTWAYDLKENLWTEWGTWNPSLARYDVFPIAGSCYAKAWNKHLFLGQDGNVYVTSRDVYRDGGSEIRTMIRTGWINHGTARRKRSKQLYVKLKSYSPTPASVLMRWRDDGRPEWSTYMELPVGSESEQTQFAKLNRMGMYRSRQYEFLMTDNADLALCGLSEEVEELRN